MTLSLMHMFFISATTPFPELTGSVSALRIGSVDMEVGNLFGSNIFNMFVLGIADVFCFDGSLFRALSPANSFPVFISILMMAVAGMGMLIRVNRKPLGIPGNDTIVIILLYISLICFLLTNV